jgi:hypothetical protein
LKLNTTNMETTETPLTPAELCTRWNNRVKESTLATWRCKGGGPDFTKIGGRVVYYPSAVAAYEESRKQKGGEKTEK